MGPRGRRHPGHAPRRGVSRRKPRLGAIPQKGRRQSPPIPAPKPYPSDSRALNPTGVSKHALPPPAPSLPSSKRSFAPSSAPCRCSMPSAHPSCSCSSSPEHSSRATDPLATSSAYALPICAVLCATRLHPALLQQPWRRRLQACQVYFLSAHPISHRHARQKTSSTSSLFLLVATQLHLIVTAPLHVLASPRPTFFSPLSPGFASPCPSTWPLASSFPSACPTASTPAVSLASADRRAMPS